MTNHLILKESNVREDIIQFEKFEIPKSYISNNHILKVIIKSGVYGFTLVFTSILILLSQCQIHKLP